MTRRINTYQELVDEKARLEALLSEQKAVIRNDFDLIGQELEPVKNAFTTAGKFFSRDSHNLLLNAGTNTLIDIFLKRVLLSRTGWITKTVVPFLLKNYSSHFISEKKGTLLRKLFAWVGKKNANGHAKVHHEEEEED